MFKIQLPANVFEDELFKFISTLGKGNNHTEIVLDFKNVTHYIPAATVAMVTAITQWKKSGKKIRLKNHAKCKAHHYLQRMEFFKRCGIKHKELIIKQEKVDRFVPIKDFENVSLLAAEIAQNITRDDQEGSDTDDDTGVKDCIEYVITQLGNNVSKHSDGNGFVTAQYHANKDIVRVVVADNGMGIRDSFSDTSYNTELATDLAAVVKSLVSGISSKKSAATDGDLNSDGIGLANVCALATKIEGDFILISGRAYVTSDEQRELLEEFRFNGTLAAFSFKRSRIKTLDVSEIIQAASK